MQNQLILRPSGLIKYQKEREEEVFVSDPPHSNPRRRRTLLFLGIGMMLFFLVLGVMVIMEYGGLNLNQAQAEQRPVLTERVTCEREIVPEDWADPINGMRFYDKVVFCNTNQRIVDILLEKKYEQYLDLPLILNYPDEEIVVTGRGCIKHLGFTAEGKDLSKPMSFRCMMVVYQLRGWKRKKTKERDLLYESDYARLGLMK